LRICGPAPMHSNLISSSRRLVLLVLLSFTLFAHAQFGPPEPQGSGPKLEAPTVFPDPGTYPTTESVTLMDADPQATIHYTWDGSMPTSKSPFYDPSQVLFIGGIYGSD
jgi:Chitobiase/beta-hexosaminidase C-terminal domain